MDVPAEVQDLSNEQNASSGRVVCHDLATSLGILVTQAYRPGTLLKVEFSNWLFLGEVWSCQPGPNGYLVGLHLERQIDLSVSQKAAEASGKRPERRLFADRFVILAANDEESVLSMIAAVVIGPPIHLLIATGGAQALDLSRCYQGNIDIFVSDADMPGLSGSELASQVVRERPGIKVLLISSAPGMDVPPKFAYLVKPFGQQELRQAIAKLSASGYRHN
jgi:CheY-like chemotaxis protein